MYYPLRYNDYRNFQKTRKVEEQTIAICQSEPFPQILEENEESYMTIEYIRLGRELEDKVFLIYIFLEKSSADI